MLCIKACYDEKKKKQNSRMGENIYESYFNNSLLSRIYKYNTYISKQKGKKKKKKLVKKWIGGGLYRHFLNNTYK